MSNRALHIIDNGLASKKGHHYNYDKAIVNAAARRGIKVFVWGHNSLIDSDILQIAKPHFSHYLYYSVTSENFITAVATHLNDIRAVIDEANSEDVIFIPNLLNVDIAALKLIIIEKDFPNPLNLLVRYHTSTDGSPESIFFINSLREICSLHASTFVFADTQSLVHALNANGINAKLISFPIDIPYSELVFENKFDFAYIGQAAHYKGYYHVINALIVGAQIGYLPRFAIQSTGIDSATLVTVMEKLPNVTWIFEAMDPHPYYQLIANADTILIYYDPSFYTVNSSGILIEALALNRRVLTTHFSHAEEMLGENIQALPTDEYNHTALLHKMIRMGSELCLPRGFLKLTDHAKNLANTNRIIDILFMP